MLNIYLSPLTYQTLPLIAIPCMRQTAECSERERYVWFDYLLGNKRNILPHLNSPKYQITIVKQKKLSREFTSLLFNLKRTVSAAEVSKRKKFKYIILIICIHYVYSVDCVFGYISELNTVLLNSLWPVFSRSPVWGTTRRTTMG